MPLKEQMDPNQNNNAPQVPQQPPNPENNPFYEPPPNPNDPFYEPPPPGEDIKSPDVVESSQPNTTEPQIDPHLQFEAEKRSIFLKDPVAALFEQEKKMAYAWLTFMSLYWTIIVLAQVIYYARPLSLGALFWIFGAIGILGMFLAVRTGLYPSGSTHLDENSNSGKGRYAAFAITLILSVDLSFLVALEMTNRRNVFELIRGIFHFISLFWGSLFFYRRFAKHNPHIARTVYPVVWIDILFTIIVMWSLEYTNNGHHCWDHRVCSIYSIFVIFQIIFWLWPMHLMTNWGLEPKASRVALHLLILAVFSDFPIFVTVITLANKSYRAHPVIWCDVLIKSFVMIRSISHFLVNYAWLREVKNDDVDKQPYIQMKDEF